MNHTLRRIAFFLIPTALLLAQQPTPAPGAQPPTEVVLTAQSGAKLPLALAPVQLKGLEQAQADQEFTAVLKRDLADSGVFAVLQAAPAGDPVQAKSWQPTGAEWLVRTNLTQGPGGDLAVDTVVVDVRSDKPVFQKGWTAKGIPLRRVAHVLADELVGRLTGTKGVAGSRVVFVRQVSPGVKELFQMDRDGGGLSQITHYASLTLSPSVAADGRLAFVTYKGGSPEIWGQRKAGGAFDRLYPTSGKASVSCFSPAWSPDGSRIAFVQGDHRGNSDIVVLDVASGRVRKLTESQGINTEPCWNPSGTQLVFTSDREGGPQLYLMQDDGSNLRRLTFEGTYNASPAWSPNGAMIAYVSRFEGKFDLFVYKLGEGKSYQITTGVSTSESPAWSPDERALVFASNRGGSMQLYATDLTGQQVQRLSDVGGCQSPKWVRSR